MAALSAAHEFVAVNGRNPTYAALKDRTTISLIKLTEAGKYTYKVEFKYGLFEWRSFVQVNRITDDGREGMVIYVKHMIMLNKDPELEM